ncbi:hypothetical protein GCM10023085_47970 [Actinomadura viridis]|uniref:Uncharacterized protein n=1 Tax=Actinomadura viridis TaxID=58110 RepID=A0A931DN90_9ACTN|nr:hypothetical protein [Actinomadura viridis]MBG6090701.1 hypothetical protein [Actinomadura viridis]
MTVPRSGVPASRRPRLTLPGLREVYEAYARAAEELPALPGALQAEVWTSAQLGALESAAPHAEGRRAALGDLITTLRAAGTPGAHTFLRVLAAIGPAGARRAAHRAAGELDGLPEPPWAGALGAVTPGQVWLIQEGPLDGDRLVCEFRYEGGAELHAVAVRLSYGDAPREVVVVGDVRALMAAARQAMQAELCVVQPYDPAAVGARLRAALDGAETFPEDCYPALALARHRVALLPGA